MSTNNESPSVTEITKIICELYYSIEKVSKLPDSRHKKSAIFNLKETIAELTLLNIDVSLNLT